ncbi:hypothetical protein CORT_0A09990 [Candida orthopsilosis Co 90-125]|uniref:RxLR effector protein n=1 Tax=Candida orthopsilosis (strain 90-125) TaxID=1136231 RepID=H8WX79_CANO9|nr:hypothetical protein CORT_0A09990 [Candida orthopsilosis Co 90-125]CCG21384.1 hypothetical protein CORT_0A09990 [Candida orthopsilosis Co 90-125]
MHSTIFFLLPLALSTIIPANLDLKAKSVGAGTQATETKRNIQNTQSNEGRNGHNKRELKSVVLGDVKSKVARDSISANELV